MDWIYPYLNNSDKARIHQVFLRWVRENMNASTTDYNHPEPHNVINDTVLISDRTRVRWSLNNYYKAHMRNNPFWKDMIHGYLHSLSPASLTYADMSWIGEVYQPSWYGDGFRFWMPDFITANKL